MIGPDGSGRGMDAGEMVRRRLGRERLAAACRAVASLPLARGAGACRLGTLALLVGLCACAPVVPDRRAAGAPHPGGAPGQEPSALVCALQRSAPAVAHAELREFLRVVEARLRAAPPGASAEETLGALAVGRTQAVLVTGYDEPLLTGREQPDARFRFPILGAPPRAASYPSRAAIEAGALADQAPILFWTDDEIGLFFLHIQGSGRLVLPNGRKIRLGYAGTNGRRYTAIGRILVERGELSLAEATAPAIRAWLAGHPAEARALMQRNERFVFFRRLELPETAGPPGALGVPLVAGRSVAVDSAVVPLGSVGILDTTLPSGQPLRRVVVAMDRGAAIRGPNRIDLFLGPGAAAAEIAGRLRSPGQVRWFVPGAAPTADGTGP